MKVVLLGGTGHLGAALQASVPVGVSLLVMGGSASAPNVFNVLSAVPLHEADVVIGSFPLARALEGRADFDDLLDRYLAACGAARLVQLSTDAVFSGRRGMYLETDTPDPESPYGVAQTRVDADLSRARPDTLLVRTSFIFGLAGGRFDKRLAPLISGQRSIVDQRWASNVFRSPTEVNFLAHAIWCAITSNLSGVLNIAGPRFSIHDFFVKSLKELGFSELPTPVAQQDPSGLDTTLDTSRMRRDLQLDERSNWEWYLSSLKDTHVK